MRLLFLLQSNLFVRQKPEWALVARMDQSMIVDVLAGHHYLAHFAREASKWPLIHCGRVEMSKREITNDLLVSSIKLAP